MLGDADFEIRSRPSLSLFNIVVFKIAGFDLHVKSSGQGKGAKSIELVENIKEGVSQPIIIPITVPILRRSRIILSAHRRAMRSSLHVCLM